MVKDQARDTAAQLQILFEKPTGDHDGLEKLLEKRFISFTESLSHLSLCRCEDCECEVTQIPNPVGSPISDQISVDSGKGKRPAAEDRRGSNERKFRGSNERSVPSKTISDSGSHSRRISSETISTQNTTSTPSSAASGREEYYRAERKKEEERKQKDKPKAKMMEPPKAPPRPYQSNSMDKEKDSCTLEHLAKLTKLRELSIYTKREDFPVISDLRDLNRLKRLHKLVIQWGRGRRGVSVHKSENIPKVDNSSEEMAAVESTKQENHGHADTEIACNTFFTAILSHLFATLSLLPVENDASPELPPQLEELHLYDLPRISAPDWLRPSKRNKMKKLHIIGGPLSDLGQLALQEKSEWQVEILSLVFLKDLEMNRTDLKKLFPKLIYFEKVRCPKLQFSPCDGAWMNEPIQKNVKMDFQKGSQDPKNFWVNILLNRDSEENRLMKLIPYNQEMIETHD
ncbi:hypothetical protein Vadar_011824 [Vaccinium darrowii]|uniref:Uncharacterized protein n=1 Tax=Vaccinium darrowii TaxID=229202 RepID=A0ACB7XR13_9ERIC|nr:hypothetical protein Vadar_011824 [Vaccinium darrowii]